MLIGQPCRSVGLVGQDGGVSVNVRALERQARRSLPAVVYD